MVAQSGNCPLERVTLGDAPWGRTAKAASTACSGGGRDAPPAAISTKVPSSGRARRISAQAGFINGQDASDAFCHVPRRQCGARNVADILIELRRIAAGL